VPLAHATLRYDCGGADMTEEDATARSVRALNGYTIGAVDGDIGWVRDAYFHDRHWSVRYLVVDTSHWLSGKRVLISPLSLRGADHAHKVLRATLTKAQVANSPDIDTEKPVSRQHEIELYQYYLPYYWVMDEGADSPYAAAASVQVAALERETDRDRQGHDDPHLRSARAVMHHYVHAIDGDMGHVADFLYDDASWRIGHLVVTTGTFRRGRRVLLPVTWVTQVSWDAGTVDVILPSETIRLAPEYDAARPLHRDYLARVAAYYATPSTARPEAS
jgi:hypothetical protein